MSFEEIFKSNFNPVVNQIYLITKNKTIAEDLAQEVFMQLYKTDWKSIENVKGWLFKSAIYAAYNNIRSNKRQTAKIEKLAIYETESTYNTLDESFIKKEEQQKVKDVLNKLNDVDKTILVMKFSGFQYKEISKALGIDAASIGTKLARAKSKFFKLYKQVEEV